MAEAYLQYYSGNKSPFCISEEDVAARAKVSQKEIEKNCSFDVWLKGTKRFLETASQGQWPWDKKEAEKLRKQLEEPEKFYRLSLKRVGLDKEEILASSANFSEAKCAWMQIYSSKTYNLNRGEYV